MELDLTTFILEIVNFLVLVWLLQHFLYKPVLAVIAKRKAGIDNALQEAARVHEQAAILQQQCEQRLALWEQEKRTAQEKLHQEIESQRARMMAELQTSLEEERNRIKVIDERRRAREQNKLEAAALQNAAVFASLLLKHAAGPDLEKRLFELLLEQLHDLSPATAETLRANHQEDLAAIVVFSAYPLSETQRTTLQQRLDALLDKSMSYVYRQDPELLAGLRILIGAWALRVNLQDELSGFTQFAHE